MRELLIQYRGAVLLALVAVVLVAAAVATKVRITLQLRRERRRRKSQRLESLKLMRDDDQVGEGELFDIDSSGQVWRRGTRG